MRFGPVDLAAAEGAILGHNVTDGEGRRVLRKGAALTVADLELLRGLGRSTVFVARLEPDDVGEDRAAERITRAVVGGGVRLSGPATGRVNVYAEAPGLARVVSERLLELNQREGVTLATVRDRTPVSRGKMIGTTKILPYAVAEATVVAVEGEARSNGPVLWLQLLPARSAGLVVAAAPSSRERVVAGFETALRRRLEALGSRLDRVDFVGLDEESGLERLAVAIGEQVVAGVELVLLAGETAIQDRHDLAPRAVERAGGTVVCFGAPVDPGNLLMVAYLGDVPVLGAPGCARSPKTNIVDLVLPRMVAGERLTRADVVALGHGGLLDDVAERPMPRRQAGR